MARAAKRTRQAAKVATTLLTALWFPILKAFPAPSAAGRVVEVEDFGPNPGGLKMFVYMPARRLPPGAPLIVALHGCGQNAAAFARDSGFIGVADRIGAALLLPEQTSRNNPGRCFNWYRLGDVRRGDGEAASIRQMVRVAIRRCSSDPRRVFIVGLSAGAAMTAAMLATYPATFAAGAAVAGMPVGAAYGGASALWRMRRASAFPSRRALADTVRRAAPTRATRAWPRLSIWQGERDQVVDPRNAEALAAQWSALHGFEGPPTSETSPWPGIRRREWRTAKKVAVELWTIADMGHGFPIDAADSGREGFGIANVGLPAARLIAGFWGLDVAPKRTAKTERRGAAPA